MCAGDGRGGEIGGVVDVGVVGGEKDFGGLLCFGKGGFVGCGGVLEVRSDHCVGGVEVVGRRDVGLLVLEFPRVAVTMANVEADGDAAF